MRVGIVLARLPQRTTELSIYHPDCLPLSPPAFTITAAMTFLSFSEYGALMGIILVSCCRILILSFLIRHLGFSDCALTIPHDDSVTYSCNYVNILSLSEARCHSHRVCKSTFYKIGVYLETNLSDRALSASQSPARAATGSNRLFVLVTAPTMWSESVYPARVVGC